MVCIVSGIDSGIAYLYIDNDTIIYFPSGGTGERGTRDGGTGEGGGGLEWGFGWGLEFGLLVVLIVVLIAALHICI